MARMTNAQLQAENDRLREQLSSSQNAHEQLKNDVVAKVRDLTDEHGWCDVAEDAMRDIGLDMTRKMRVTLVWESVGITSGETDAVTALTNKGIEPSGSTRYGIDLVNSDGDLVSDRNARIEAEWL